MYQVAFVKWGTKYPAAYVNALVEATLRGTSEEVEFVCLTEDGDGIDPRVRVVPFPDQGVPVKTLTSRGGSLLKLGMFHDGVLKDRVETIYLDLDTAVVGDVARLADCLRRTGGVYALSRHAVQYWRISGLMRMIAPERYYLSNTAIMAFYPEELRDLALDFKANYHRYDAGNGSLDARRKKLYRGGNEYLISQAAQGRLRVFPRDVAIKFTQEYMSPLSAVARLKNHMPWIKARRARQAVLTFHGEALKPEHLVNMQDGQLVTQKFHKTIWRYPEIRDYWREFLTVE